MDTRLSTLRPQATIAVTSGGDGHFRFGELARGRYSVWAESAGRFASALVVLHEDSPDAEVRLDLRGGGQMLRGRAVQVDGKPWSGLVCVSLDRPGDEHLGVLPGNPRPVQTRADGTFEFEGLPPGYARVGALEPASLFVSGFETWLPHEGELRVIVDEGLTWLEGRVLADNSDQPIAGAIVRVRDSWRAHDSRFLARAVTAEDGRFRVRATRGGVHVHVHALGNLEARIHLEHLASPLLVRLTTAGLVGGRVTDSESGDGVAGIRVVATPDYAGPDDEFVRSWAVTDQDGRYEIPDAPVGSVFVQAFGAGWVTSGLTDATKGEFVVPVRPGARTHCDLVVVRGGVVAGRVADPEGAGVAGARVWAERWGRVVGNGFQHLISTRTRSDGTYELQGLLDRTEYTVGVDAPGFQPGKKADLIASLSKPLHVDFGLRRPCSVTVRVTDPSGAPLPGAEVSVKPRYRRAETYRTDKAGEVIFALVLPRDHSIDVRARGVVATETLGVDASERAGEALLFDVQMVRASLVAGRVTFSDGTPASGVAVALDIGGVQVSEVTDGDGAFDIQGVPEGRGSVTATLGKYSWGRHEAQAQVVAGETGVLLRLPCGPVEREDPFTVLVVDDGGEPVPLASGNYNILGEDGQSIGSGGLEVVAGRAALPWGSSCSIQVERASSSSGGPMPLGPAAYEGVIPSSREVQIQLPPERAITGRVVDESGRPLRGVSLIAGPATGRGEYLDRHGEGRTTVDGSFRIGGLGDMRYRIDVDVPRGFMAGAPHHAEAGSDGVEITIKRGAEATITVLDPAGAPVAGVSVGAITIPDDDWSDGEWVPHAETGADGQATLTGLKPGGRYRLSVSPPYTDEGYHHLGRSLAEWHPADTTVQVEPAVTLSGRLLDPTGNPIEGAHIEVCAVGGDYWRYEDTSNADGSFEVGGIGEELVQLRAKVGFRPGPTTWRPGRAYPHASLRHSPVVRVNSKTSNLGLTLDPGRRMAVRVRNWPRSTAATFARLVEERADQRPGATGEEDELDLSLGFDITARMGADGAAEFFSVPPEKSYVFVVGPLDDGSMVYARGLKGRVAPHEARLEPGGVVRGVARVPKGAGSPHLVLEGTGLRLEAEVEANGRFEFAGVPPGRWSIKATASTSADEGDVEPSLFGPPSEDVLIAEAEASPGDVLDLTLSPPPTAKKR